MYVNLINSAALHKAHLVVEWQGSVYPVLRQSKNIYGEKIEEPKEVAQIKGIYHNGASNHIEVKTSEAGSIIEKNSPYILTSWKEVENVQLDDQIPINDRYYKITGKTNLGELNILGEISLEVVL